VKSVQLDAETEPKKFEKIVTTETIIDTIEFVLLNVNQQHQNAETISKSNEKIVMIELQTEQIIAKIIVRKDVR
jgi:hypothetical protein